MREQGPQKGKPMSSKPSKTSLKPLPTPNPKPYPKPWVLFARTLRHAFDPQKVPTAKKIHNFLNPTCRSPQTWRKLGNPATNLKAVSRECTFVCRVLNQIQSISSRLRVQHGWLDRPCRRVRVGCVGRVLNLGSLNRQFGLNPKGPCTQIVYTLALK